MHRWVVCPYQHACQRAADIRTNACYEQASAFICRHPGGVRNSSCAPATQQLRGSAAAAATAVGLGWHRAHRALQPKSRPRHVAIGPGSSQEQRSGHTAGCARARVAARHAAGTARCRLVAPGLQTRALCQARHCQAHEVALHGGLMNTMPQPHHSECDMSQCTLTDDQRSSTWHRSRLTQCLHLRPRLCQPAKHWHAYSTRTC